MPVQVAVAQYPITAFTDLAAWRRHTAEWVKEATQQGARLLVFPEYGAMELTSLLPIPVQQDLAAQLSAMQNLLDPFMDCFAALSKQTDAIIVAPSFPVSDNGRMINRSYVFSPGGRVGYQDKYMMTRFELEDWGVASGQAQLTVFEADWGLFGVQICYDIEFPLGAQLLCAAGVQLIVCPSCTETLRGATRVHVGARARALENQCYVAVAQTIGEAPWSPAVDLNYGYAAFYSTPDKDLPEDGILALGAAQKAGWTGHSLHFETLEAVRADGQVFNFKDTQRIYNPLTSDCMKVFKVQL